jgi:hypothetical protein
MRFQMTGMLLVGTMTIAGIAAAQNTPGPTGNGANGGCGHQAADSQ